MTKRPMFEWLIADNEQTWNRWEQQHLSDQAPPAVRHSYRRRCYSTCFWVLILLLMAGASYWQWQQNTAAQRQVHTTLQAVVDAQSRQTQADQQPPSEILSTRYDIANAGVTVQAVTLHGDTVMAQITMVVPATETRRTTWFYKQTTAGWQRTVPSISFWGAPETVDTTYFHFAVRARDASTVRAVANRIDEHYRSLRSSLGLSPFVNSKENYHRLCRSCTTA